MGVKRTHLGHPNTANRRGEFNRSTQHLLILLDWEVSDGGECTDMVHAEAEGRALAAMEERSMRGGHRPRVGKEEQERCLSGPGSAFGGIAPTAARRAARALRLKEPEEISRGIAASDRHGGDHVGR